VLNFILACLFCQWIITHIFQDVVLARMMDDSMVASLNSIIHANNATVRFRMLTELIRLLYCRSLKVVFSCRLLLHWRTTVPLFRNCLLGWDPPPHLMIPKKTWWVLVIYTYTYIWMYIVLWLHVPILHWCFNGHSGMQLKYDIQNFLYWIWFLFPSSKEYFWYFIPASGLFSAWVLLLKQKPPNGTPASVVQVNNY